MSRKIFIVGVIVFLSLLFGISCSRNETARKLINCTSLEIDPHKAQNTNISEFASSISYIKLETNVNCLVSSISDFTVYDDRFYFIDYHQELVYCFNNEGKFVFKIDKKGKGPGEFINISSFAIDKENRQLLIYDRSKMEVLYYNLEGTYQKSDRVKFQRAEMGIIDSKSYYFYNYDMPDPSFVLQRIERNSTRLISEHIRQCRNTDYLRHTVFNHDNSRLTFNYGFNDTIFSINSDGSIDPLFNIIFKGKSKLFEKLKNVDREDTESQKALRMNQEWSNIQYHRTSQNYLLAIYDSNSRISLILHSKKSGRVLNMSSVLNDIDGVPLGFYPKYITDSVFYYIVNPLEILNLVEDKTNMISSSAIKEILPIDDMSNPIIAIVHIDQF